MVFKVWHAVLLNARIPTYNIGFSKFLYKKWKRRKIPVSYSRHMKKALQAVKAIRNFKVRIITTHNMLQFLFELILN